MRVAYPWSFDSKNYHVRIKLYKSFDIASVIGINPPDMIDCKTDNVLLTFSEVVSSINENENISYHEFIIKAKVNIEGKEYYYPLITFVDNEYSLIRGFYLGFVKEFAKIKIKDHKIFVENDRIKLEMNIYEDNLGECKDEFNTYPFILYRDWKFNEETPKKEYVTLITKEYRVKKIKMFDIDKENMVKILKRLCIERNNVNGIEKVYLEDTFVLEGTEVCMQCCNI